MACVHHEGVLDPNGPIRFPRCMIQSIFKASKWYSVPDLSNALLPPAGGDTLALLDHLHILR